MTIKNFKHTMTTTDNPQEAVSFQAGLGRFGTRILRNENENYDPSFTILGEFVDDEGEVHQLNASVKILRNIPGISVSIVNEEGSAFTYPVDHENEALRGKPMELSDIPFETRTSGAMVLDGGVKVEVSEKVGKTAMLGIFGEGTDDEGNPIEVFNVFLDNVSAPKVQASTARAAFGKPKKSVVEAGNGAPVPAA